MIYSFNVHLKKNLVQKVLEELVEECQFYGNYPHVNKF